MTRDSLVWPITIVSAVLTFVLGNQDLLQDAFPGLSPEWEARIELLAGLIGVVAGLLHMSPLKLSPAGREKFTGGDKGSIDPTRFSGTGVLLLAALVSVSACTAAAPPPDRVPPAPATHRKAASDLVKAVDWAATTLDVARTLQQVEIAAHKNGRVSDAQHRAIQEGFREFAVVADEALKVAQDLTKAETTRFEAARLVAGFAARLLERIERHLPAEAFDYVSAIKATLYLLGVPPQGVEE